MKSAVWWTEDFAATFDPNELLRYVRRLVLLVQADAIESAAKDLGRSLCFNEDGETSGPPGHELPIPPQELKWVESIRKLKP